MELFEKGIFLISFSLIGAMIESLIPMKLTVLIMGFLMLLIEFDLSTSIRTYKEIRNESKIGVIIKVGFQSLFFKRFLLII